MPTSDEWVAENSGYIDSADAFGGFLMLPAAGVRKAASGSTVANAGMTGDYWSKTSSDKDPGEAYRYYFNSGDSRDYSDSGSGAGHSIRCIKDPVG